MQNNQRVHRELMQIKENPPSGIVLLERGDKLDHFDITIIGPDQTPYKNGVYNLEMKIPENYPFAPPSIKFITPIYHPNIDNVGRICLDLMKMPPKGTWRPTIGLLNLLIAVRMLLETPNPDDPLMPEIAHEFKYNRKEFDRKARERCTCYANGNG